MARSSFRDPLEKFRWIVSVPGFSKMGFTTTSTPSYAITTRKYKEGGAHYAPKQIIDSVEYAPVTLTRGATNDTSFNKWATGWVDKVTDNAAFKSSSSLKNTDGSINFKAVAGAVVGAAANSGATPVKSNSDAAAYEYRRDVKIEHVNRAGQTEVVYMLYGAFPIEYKPASDFDSMGDDTVSIESITLAYDSFEVLYSGLAGSIANIAARTLL